MPEIMNIKEVAAYLRIHTSTVYRMLKAKQLPSFRVGRDHRFSMEAVDAWRKKQEQS